MTRIFNPNENIHNAVDSIRLHGYAAIEGTKSIAEPCCERVLKALKAYPNIQAVRSYKNVQKQGYLYFIYDTIKFTSTQIEVKIDEIDLRSKL